MELFYILNKANMQNNHLNLFLFHLIIF